VKIVNARRVRVVAAGVLLAGGLGVIGLTALYDDGYERFGYTAIPPEPCWATNR